MSTLPFRQVAIVGLGLMGGSLALALRQLRDRPRVTGLSRDAEELRSARRAGALDEGSEDAHSALAGADLVVYATPTRVTLELLREHRDLWLASAVVSDVGSVKRPVLAEAARLGLEPRFVGGHPMAGGHRSGFAAARADLYQGARVWLVAGQGGENALQRVAELWRAVGARPESADAEAHDLLMAWVSHLPQVAASALGIALARAAVAPDTLGPGGRDATRLAASAPELWADILLENGDLLQGPLRGFAAAVQELADEIAGGDRARLEALLARAREWREGT